MTRKNNVTTRKLNDHIDHKNVVVIWISLWLQINKIFFFRACIKKDGILAFLILGFIFDHVFGPKNNKLIHLRIISVFVFRKGMSYVICDFVLYLQVEALNISWIYPSTIQFQLLKTVFVIQYSTLSLGGSEFIFLKCDGLIWDIGGKFRQKRIHLFWAFWSLIFKFFFKQGNHEKHP